MTWRSGPFAANEMCTWALNNLFDDRSTTPHRAFFRSSRKTSSATEPSTAIFFTRRRSLYSMSRAKQSRATSPKYGSVSLWCSSIESHVPHRERTAFGGSFEKHRSATALPNKCVADRMMMCGVPVCRHTGDYCERPVDCCCVGCCSSPQSHTSNTIRTALTPKRN